MVLIKHERREDPVGPPFLGVGLRVAGIQMTFSLCSVLRIPSPAAALVRLVLARWRCPRVKGYSGTWGKGTWKVSLWPSQPRVGHPAWKQGRNSAISPYWLYPSGFLKVPPCLHWALCFRVVLLYTLTGAAWERLATVPIHTHGWVLCIWVVEPSSSCCSGFIWLGDLIVSCLLVLTFVGLGQCCCAFMTFLIAPHSFETWSR